MTSEGSINNEKNDSMLGKDEQLSEKNKLKKERNLLINVDGQKLFCKYWVNEMSSFTPKGLVFIAHGYAEHCLRYTQLAHTLIKQQLYPFAHDHVGHGQSEGPEVSISKFDVFVRDVIQHINIVKDRFPSLPVYIIGHSMGGCIALRACLKEPDVINKMVLIGAAVIPFKQVDNFCVWSLLKIVASFCPELPLLAKINENMLTYNEQQVALIQNDPLIYHGFMKAGFIKVFTDALYDLQENLPKIHCPILILHGQQDVVVPPEHSKVLHEKVSSQNKTLKIYPELRHQLHAEKEPESDAIRQEIGDWLLTN